MHFNKTAVLPFVGVLTNVGRNKNKQNVGRDANGVRKLLRIMKLTTFILLTACMGASARTTAQTVSFSGKDVSLQTVFDAVTKQTGYTVFCNYDLLRNAKKVTLRVRNATLDQVMQEALKDQTLTYTIIEKTIVIKATADLSSAGGGGTQSVTEVDKAPPIDITGRVTDADGNPLAGATVKVKGSSKGTTTNNDGVFVLKGVDDNATLEISFVGFETYTISLSSAGGGGLKAGGGLATIALKIKPESLNEVVINKGYYTEKQKYSLSNAGTITSSEIEKQPVNNPILALQGRVPGLEIVQSTGIPGSRTTVRIQGINSIGYGNDPLYVIDGVPYVSQMLTTTSGTIFGGQPTGIGSGLLSGGGDPLSYINPSDIERIDILKDADATSIYGSRAANGAILITTKKGRSGQMKFDFNVEHGLGKVTRMIDMMNTQQYLTMRREAYRNDNLPIPSIVTSPNDANYDINGLWDTTQNTNWQKELIGGTANFSTVTAGVSGGSNGVQYLISGTYHRETTVFPGDFSDQKGSLHFNINSESKNKKFNIQLSGSYLLDKNSLPGTDLTTLAVSLAPNSPSLYNSDGSLNWAPTLSGASSWLEQPISYIYRAYENTSKSIVASSILGYKILPGLEVQTRFGYTSLLTDEFSANLTEGIKPESRATNIRKANYSFSSINTWIIEPQLSFSKHLGLHDFDLLGGTTFQEQNSDGKSFQGSDYANDQVLKDMRSAASILATNSVLSLYRYSALFGRINYRLNDKYLINLTSRRDGSSRFGNNNKFNNFWSAGAGWIFSSESLAQQILKFLSFGKLKASYGTTGNDQIGDYAYMPLYRSPLGSFNNYQGAASLQPTGAYNPYLEWEETRKLQVGLELGFVHDKVFLTSNYYRNRSSNQLLGYDLPVMSGFSSVTTNFPAKVENSGWEFSLLGKIINKKDVTFNCSLNITIPKNRLVDFPGLEKSSYSNSLVIGQPIGIIKVYQFLGVDPVSGDYKIADKNGNATATPISTDANVLIDKLPKYFGGFQSSLSLYNFSIDLFFQFSNQIGSTYTYINVPGRFISGRNNQPVEAVDRWQMPGDVSTYQRYTQGSSLVNLSNISTTANFGDASFIRVKNFSLAYEIPEKLKHKIGLQRTKVYVHGQNLFTLTNYKGMDPENRSVVRLPPLRVITVGLQATLN